MLLVVQLFMNYLKNTFKKKYLMLLQLFLKMNKLHIELNNTINILLSIKFGVGPEILIAIFLERPIEAIVIIIDILKLGVY